jgi:hypothetical protein
MVQEAACCQRTAGVCRLEDLQRKKRNGHPEKYSFGLRPVVVQRCQGVARIGVFVAASSQIRLV